MRMAVESETRLLPPPLAALLPISVLSSLQKALPPGVLPEEIRLRRDHAASVTAGGVNVRLDAVLTEGEMERLLTAFCGGSLYAHGDTLRQGYLMLPGGVRVGVCGRAAMADGVMTGVTDIAAFSIRVPRALPPVGNEICALLRSFDLCRGVLVYAPPGVGKTTLLRGVTTLAAGGENPLRVAVVDTRGELEQGLDDPALLVDVLSGYPRGAGVEIAARTLSAQLIVCDEIGDLDEAMEIAAVHNSGVPLLASAHAGDLSELLRKPGVRLLHEARCFGAYVRLFRRPDFDFEYHIENWEAADACIEMDGTFSAFAVRGGRGRDRAPL